MVVPPARMLVFNFSTSIVASAVMVALPDTRGVLWAGSAVLGLAMSSVYAAGFHCIEDFIDLTGRCVHACCGLRACVTMSGVHCDCQ